MAMFGLEGLEGLDGMDIGNGIYMSIGGIEAMVENWGNGGAGHDNDVKEKEEEEEEEEEADSDSERNDFSHQSLSSAFSIYERNLRKRNAPADFSNEDFESRNELPQFGEYTSSSCPECFLYSTNQTSICVPNFYLHPYTSSESYMTPYQVQLPSPFSSSNQPQLPNQHIQAPPLFPSAFQPPMTIPSDVNATPANFVLAGPTAPENIELIGAAASRCSTLIPQGMSKDLILWTNSEVCTWANFFIHNRRNQGILRESKVSGLDLMRIILSKTPLEECGQLKCLPFGDVVTLLKNARTVIDEHREEDYRRRDKEYSDPLLLNAMANLGQPIAQPRWP